jgi:hypothetical protein
MNSQKHSPRQKESNAMLSEGECDKQIYRKMRSHSIVIRVSQVQFSLNPVYREPVFYLWSLISEFLPKHHLFYWQVKENFIIWKSLCLSYFNSS